MDHGYPDGEKDISGITLKYIYSSLGVTLNDMAKVEKDWLSELLPFLAKEDNGWASNGVLRKYNQHDFSDATPDGFAEQGYIYYPHSCYADGASCKLHFFLHGCGGTCYL